MGAEALVGVAVALVVPVWLVVEEVLHRFRAFDRPDLAADGGALAKPATRTGSPAVLSRKAA
jgi:hypothetical protein